MVDIWVADNLLFFRDASGDAYKEVNKILDMKFNIGNKGWEYAKVAKFVSKRVFGNDKPGQWNFAEQNQLERRKELTQRIANAAEFGNFTNIDDVLKSV